MSIAGPSDGPRPDSGPVVWSERLGTIAHDHSGPGLPYAEAGVAHGLATATCPECGRTFTERDYKPAVPDAELDGPKRASAAYADHYTAAAREEADRG